jgi:phosphatidylglycerol:prolipoprotein diacylglycerol transferase
MFPVLFEIWGLKFHTYGVAMATAFIVGIYLSSRRAPKEGIDPNLVVDAAFWVFVGTLLGGRLAFILEHIREYRQYPLEALKIWKGGLVFYGGFIGALTLSGIFVWTRKVSLSKYFDLLTPYAGLGYAIHRAGGCFMAGCCYGSPTDLPWGVAFHDRRSLIPDELMGVRLHPTQLYEALNGLVLFLLLLFLRGKKKADGELAALFFLIFSVNRFIIEYFRGEKGRELWGSLTTVQVESLFLFAFGLAIFLIARRKHGTQPGNK